MVWWPFLHERDGRERDQGQGQSKRGEEIDHPLLLSSCSSSPRFSIDVVFFFFFFKVSPCQRLIANEKNSLPQPLIPRLEVDTIRSKLGASITRKRTPPYQYLKGTPSDQNSKPVPLQSGPHQVENLEPLSKFEADTSRSTWANVVSYPK